MTPNRSHEDLLSIFTMMIAPFNAFATHNPKNRIWGPSRSDMMNGVILDQMGSNLCIILLP